MINTTVPTTEKFQLKPETRGCVLCKDCRHWAEINFGWGMCERITEMDSVNVVIDPSWSYDCAIETHANFGCVLGERNPIEDDDELAERLR